VTVLAKIRALSNETRFEIVKLVRDREMDAGTVARRFKMTRPAVPSTSACCARLAFSTNAELDRSVSMSCEQKPSMSLSSSSKDIGVLGCDD